MVMQKVLTESYSIYQIYVLVSLPVRDEQNPVWKKNSVCFCLKIIMQVTSSNRFYITLLNFNKCLMVLNKHTSTTKHNLELNEEKKKETLREKKKKNTKNHRTEYVNFLCRKIQWKQNYLHWSKSHHGKF